MEIFNTDLEQLDIDRQKYFTGENFRKGYEVFNGYTLPESFKLIQKEIEDFEVYDDDIWVTSFPKCGTTWSQEMIWFILKNLDYETGKKDIDLRMPFIEYGCVFYTSDKKFDEHYPGFLRNSVEFARNYKRPRIIKSHLPFDLLPRQIRTFERNPKIIHIYRDIKDTCVSYYHHSKLLENYTGDFDLFWKLFITGKLCWTPMVDNILSYWQFRHLPNFLILRFEDMKNNLPSVVRTTSRFLNKSFTDQQIDELVSHLSFDAMKNNIFVQKHMLLNFCKAIGTCKTPEGEFIRSGKAGDHKSKMSPEIDKIFDEYLKEKLKNSDLKFN